MAQWPTDARSAVKEKARLRITNPISGGLWEVVLLTIAASLSATPRVARCPWTGEESKPRVAKLYQQLNRVAGLSAEDYASASVIQLTLGEETSARLFAQKARENEYEKANSLELLIAAKRP